MGEVDEFVATVLLRQRQADLALLNGDSGPRKMLWSHNEPVTVLGAAKTVSGWPEVESLFDWLASNFSNGTLYELDVTGASVSGDLVTSSALSTQEHRLVVRHRPQSRFGSR